MRTDSFRLGRWLIEPQLNTLTLEGAVKRVEPKAMEVLVYLAEHAGEVIPRETIIRAIWCDRFVTDEVLTNAIFELRKALGDDARNSRFIQTIPKRGYRLVASVSFGVSIETGNQAVSEAAEVLQSNPATACKAHRRGKPIAALAAVLLLALAGLMINRWQRRSDAVPNARLLTRPLNLEARAAYLEGRRFWSRRTEAGLRQGLAHFERAVRIDPEYSTAYAGLADAYRMLESLNAMTPNEAGPKARAAALKAVRLDARSAEARASFAFVKFAYDWDWEGAEREFKTALILDPNYAPAHLWYSQLLLAAGRTDEAQAANSRALMLEPYSLATQLNTGELLLALHRYDDALIAFQHVLEIDPNFAPALKAKGHIYDKQGRYEEAAVAYEKARIILGLPPVARFYRDFTRWSKEKNARFLVHKLSAILKQRYVRPSLIARLHANFGEKEQAFVWLERAYRERDNYLLFINADDNWTDVRDDPRFAALAARITPSL